MWKMELCRRLPNAYYARIHGYTPAEVLGRHFSIFHTAKQMRDVGRVMHSLLRNGQFTPQEIWHTRNDTSEFPMIMSGVVVKDEYDVPQFLAVTGIDITRRKQAETALLESEERFRLSMEATTDGVWDWNLQTDAVYFSPSYVRMLGYETTEVPAHVTSWIDLIHPEDKTKAFEANMDCIENRVESFAVEFRMQARNGDWKWILGRGRAVSRDASGRAIRLIGTHQDITERKMTEEHIRLMATTDELTGLWNRRYFLQALEQELERAARYGKAFSILLIDIDHFKRINDLYGHDGGDKALRHFARTLQKELRQVDVMGRLGGEEFGILLPQTGSDGAFHFAERLRECIASSQIPVGDAAINLTISIGATTFQDGQTMDEILKSADDALYRAKNSGRNQTVVYHDAEEP